MLSYTETKFINSLKELRAKYAKFIPDEYQVEFERDVYGVWKVLNKAEVVEYIMDQLNKKQKAA